MKAEQNLDNYLPNYNFRCLCDPTAIQLVETLRKLQDYVAILLLSREIVDHAKVLLSLPRNFI